MSKLVKLSDKLVVEARATSKLTERSISEQIEFWTSLGRAVDALLSGKTVLALKQRGDAVSISDCFSDIDAPAGKARVEAVLKGRPFPHYESGGKRGD